MSKSHQSIHKNILQNIFYKLPDDIDKEEARSNEKTKKNKGKYSLIKKHLKIID